MIDVRDSERAINTFAFKVGRRLVAAGAPAHLIEDVKQELWVAWCVARDKYDEASPASFKTFLYNGMRLHINRWCEKHVTRRHAEVVAYSLDMELGEEGDGGSLHEVLPSADPTPDVQVFEQRDWDRVMTRLQPRARLFMETLKEPPQELLAELRCLAARADYAKENGITVPFQNRITSTLVFDAMGASRWERTKIAAEIGKVVDKMQRINSR